MVFSRTGAARTILGLVSDAPALSAPALLQTYALRWTVEQFCKDRKPLLGLGHDQNRASGAAVRHLPLVCLVDALLPHRRIARAGAQGQRTRKKAADWAMATAQDHLRSLVWQDLVDSLTEKHHDESWLKDLERLRVA